MAKKKKVRVPWWAVPLAGVVLIVIPEPSTTAIGTAMVVGSLGYRGIQALS